MCFKTKKNNSLFDEKIMRECILLAKKGFGKTGLNPLVGAIIVRQKKIVGKGFHEKFGSNHAEINALKAAGKKAKNSVLYVNLEPCNHKGKTGPCTKKIIKAGIKSVVIGTLDPNPLVNGKGVKELKKAGIKTSKRVLKKECLELNKGFFCFVKKHRPFITLKAALTKNGCMTWGNRKNKKISSKKADLETHKLRAEHQAILVGVKTIKKDNPQLNTRLVKGKNPAIIVLDSFLETPLNSKILESKQRKIIFCSKKARVKKALKLAKKDCEIIMVDSKKEKLFLKQVIECLTENGLLSVLVEGGEQVLNSFLKQKLFDQVIVVHSKKVFSKNCKKHKIFCYTKKYAKKKELEKETIYYAKS